MLDFILGFMWARCCVDKAASIVGLETVRSKMLHLGSCLSTPPHAHSRILQKRSGILFS